jgi:hypothetical protein
MATTANPILRETSCGSARVLEGVGTEWFSAQLVKSATLNCHQQACEVIPMR